MARSIKQEAFSHFKDEFELVGRGIVFGYDKDYNVLGVATSKEELREVLKTKGVAGVILSDKDTCAVGYDFIKGEQYLGLKQKREHPADYQKKQNAEVIKGVEDVQSMILNNNKFIEKFMGWLEDNNVSYSKTTRQLASGYRYMDEVSLYIGRRSITVSEFGTTVSTDTDFLVVHDSNVDIEADWYKTFMSRLLKTSESTITELFSDIM
ncbi:hypothetical protein COF68_06120 [Bacillus toyonensis]|uniref:hypothetical protein n=1 Tax=Bacillus toyonensis TaxID=155322 RepID=UPI000BFDAAA8|nr:hypothetical protein [Bacillus toyonensis]PHE64410.1 hypothetical protein COF68_06120 [Bacillus toyonensis]